MSQSPGFPSTWAVGAGIALGVPGNGQAVSPWLLFNQRLLSVAQPCMLHQELGEGDTAGTRRGAPVDEPRFWGNGFPLLLSVLMQ